MSRPALVILASVALLVISCSARNPFDEWVAEVCAASLPLDEAKAAAIQGFIDGDLDYAAWAGSYARYAEAMASIDPPRGFETDHERHGRWAEELSNPGVQVDQLSDLENLSTQPPGGFRRVPADQLRHLSDAVVGYVDEHGFAACGTQLSMLHPLFPVEPTAVPRGPL